MNGIDAVPVQVEVNCGYGDTLIVVVGLPDAAVKEFTDRVSTDLANSSCNFLCPTSILRGMLGQPG